MNFGIAHEIKNIFKYSIIILLSSQILASSALADSNLVANPGFEIGTTTPLNWALVAEGSNIPSWDSVSHSGVRSIKILISGTTNIVSGYPKSDLITAQPLMNYTVSAWGKTLNAGGSNVPTVRVVELDANKNWIRQNNLPVFSKGTNDWMQKTMEFQTTANTAYLYVYANIWNGYGAFWVDDVIVGLKTTKLTLPCGNYGDINNDGYITREDGGLLANNISNPNNPVYFLASAQLARADVNGNGKIDIGDALAIGNYVAGNLNTFKICSQTVSPTPSATSTPAPTPSATPTPAPTPSTTPTATPTPSPTPTPAPTPSPMELNLAANPGFEIGITMPQNWAFVSQGGNIPSWDSVSHSGSKSIKISIPGTTNIVSGHPKSDLMEAQPLTNYIVSAWGKTENAGGSNVPTVRVVELDANKNWLRQNNLPGFSMGTNDWTKKTLEFQTAPNTAYLYFYANIWNGYGTFWVDDLTVNLKTSAPVPTSTPAPTPSPIPTPSQTPIATPTPAPTPTSTPVPTSTPAPTPSPIPTPSQTPAPEDTNLAANPGFEIGTTTPLNWELVAQNGNMPSWDSVSHNGSKSIKMSIPGTTDIVSGNPKSDIITAQPLTTYMVSAWGKTENAGGSNVPTVRVVELDANKNWLRQTNLPEFSKGTNDWTQKTVELQTGSTTAYLYVYANIWNGYGTFWVDDIAVSLKNTQTTTPVQTPTPSPTSAPTPAPSPTSTPSPTTPTQITAFPSPFNSEGPSVVKIDSDKNLIINGKKVFPQIFYCICNQGTTTTSTCLQNLQRMNIYTADIVAGGYTGSFDPLYLQTKVGFAPMIGASGSVKNNPDLLGYMQVDEPNNNAAQIPSLVNSYNNLKATDPNHIVIATDWRWFKALTGVADVLVSDLYPKKNGWSLNSMGTFDNLMYFYESILYRDVYEGNTDEISRPVWNIIQALATEDDGGALPLTQKETRNMMYTSITMNVKGLVYYTYAWSPVPNAVLSKDQIMTQNYINLAKEVNSLNDVLVLPSKDYSWQFRKGTEVSFSNNPARWNGYQQLNYMLKQNGNTYYLIVVNKDVSSITTDITIKGMLGTSIATEIGLTEAGSNPGRTLTVNNGKFKDSFDGMAVHIYQIS